MTGFDELTLIAKSYSADELGQKIPAETQRDVFCRVESVSRTEFFDAARVGLRPEYKATLSFAEDYQGEESAEYEGVRYAVYRTYGTPGGGIELYLRKETGITNG